MSLVVQGFSRSNVTMEEHTHLFISPPVARCHSTSSLPRSLSTTLCWKPLRCPPPSLLCPPLFLEPFASQCWGGPGAPLLDTGRWEPLLLSRWPRLSAAPPGHWPLEAVWNAGGLSGDNVAGNSCCSAERPPSGFDGHNPASACTGWTWLPWALAFSDWSVGLGDRRSLFRCSVMGGPLRYCGLALPPLLWCLWAWLPLQWDNPGAGCSTEGPVGADGPSTSGLPFSATVWGSRPASGSTKEMICYI